MTKPKNPEDLQKVGRPDTPINYKEIEELSRCGLTYAEMGESIGMTPDGFRKRRHNDPELVSAIKRGRIAVVKAISNAIYKKAVEEGDTTAQIFLLKTRGKYMEYERRKRLKIEEKKLELMKQSIEQNKPILKEIDTGNIPVNPNEATNIYKDFMR